MLSTVDLPEFYAISAPLQIASDRPVLEQPRFLEWLSRFERLSNSGVSLIQIRVKDLGPAELRILLGACASLAKPRDVKLLLNGPESLAMEHNLAGVHLTSARLRTAKDRTLPKGMLLGASCHSPAELKQAEAIGADFACLSPVNRVEGYENGQSLGFELFGRWASACCIPVYGLGGLAREDLQHVVKVGGQGVAGISAFW